MAVFSSSPCTRLLQISIILAKRINGDENSTSLESKEKIVEIPENLACYLRSFWAAFRTMSTVRQWDGWRPSCIHKEEMW